MPAASLLRELRNRRRTSLRKAAEELDVAPSQLSRTERGERPLTATLAARAASYYGVSADFLLLQTGRLPEDVVEILQRHPELIAKIRSWDSEVTPGKGKE